jgi:hypothetical protein
MFRSIGTPLAAAIAMMRAPQNAAAERRLIRERSPVSSSGHALSRFGLEEQSAGANLLLESKRRGRHAMSNLTPGLDAHRVQASYFAKKFLKGGGPSRNRTGVQGFAVLCVTTPPSGPEVEPRRRQHTTPLPRPSLRGQPQANCRLSFDEGRLAFRKGADMSGFRRSLCAAQATLNSKCISGI